MKIALIEDETLIRETLQELLQIHYETDSFECIKDFLKTDNYYDIIIGDINLPDGNLLNELKKYPKLVENSLLIIISAEGNIENIKKSFELGAIDFLKKPFEFEELLLRIERFIKNKKDIKLDENILYSPSKKVLIINNKTIDLSMKEAAFLELLIEKKGAYVSFNEIEAKIWGQPIVPNTLAALVKRLRKKLSKNIIESKRYLGYKLITSS